MEKDSIFINKKEQLRSALSFIKAITNNCSNNEAFKIIQEASNNYAISYYSKVFKNILLGNRFDKFRKHYEKYSKTVPHCEVIESTKKKLKIKYSRCPLDEVLESENLLIFNKAFHKSDKAFTNFFLPNITFDRYDGIKKGNKFYTLTWTKKI